MSAAEWISLIAVILSILSAWGIASYKIGRKGSDVDTNTDRIVALEDAFRKHREAEKPHTTCIGHAACIDNIEKGILSINSTLEEMNKRIWELVQYKRNGGSEK